MKPALIAVIALLVVILAITLFDFRVTEEGSVPDIDVSVTGGELPEAEIKGPEFNVETTTKTVEVPTDVEVKTETKTIEVPSDIGLTIPEDK